MKNWQNTMPYAIMRALKFAARRAWSFALMACQKTSRAGVVRNHHDRVAVAFLRQCLSCFASHVHRKISRMSLNGSCHDPLYSLDTPPYHFSGGVHCRLHLCVVHAGQHAGQPRQCAEGGAGQRQHLGLTLPEQQPTEPFLKKPNATCLRDSLSNTYWNFTGFIGPKLLKIKPLMLKKNFSPALAGLIY
jgi:hypothetical protein